jgi:hypothetical protein
VRTETGKFKKKLDKFGFEGVEDKPVMKNSISIDDIKIN